MNSKNILYGGEYDRKFEYKSMGDFIVSSLRRNGDRKALVNASTGLTWTSREFLDQVKKYSSVLYGIGVRRNSIIGIVSENRHEVAALMFASLCLNAIPAPINFTYTKRELKHSLDLSKPKLLFVSSLVLDNIHEIVNELPYVEKMISFDKTSSADKNWIPLNELVNKYEDPTFDLEKYVQQPINIRQQTSMIFLSSGTTGYSKGVEKSCENLFVCFEQYARNITNLSGFGYDINTLVLGPWFHVMGFTNLFILLFSDRFCCVFLPKFEPHLFLKTIQSYKIASIPIPPPIVVLLAKSALVDEYDISSLKYIFTGAAPLSYDVEQQIMERYKGQIKLLRGYGLSEAIITVYTINVQNPPPASVGKLLKGCYGKVVDGDGNAIGPKTVGEICHKGLLVMKGYFNNPKATAESIDRDGWFHTGDLGYYDEQHNFFIVDRLKELIKYKGFQVAPAELEGLLLSNPQIKDAGVIGIYDEVAGELPMAFVVTQPNSEITESEVKDFVAERISKAKWLRGGVKFIDEIPKNPSGELKHSLSLTKPKIVFTSSHASNVLLELITELPFIRQVVLLDDPSEISNVKAIPLKDFIAAHEWKFFNIENHISNSVDMRRRTSIIFLSSGTTGIAKGCEISQYNMAVTISSLQKSLGFLKQFTNNVVNLNISPWFHCMGHVHIFSNLLSESFVCVYLPKFDQRHFLQAIEMHKVIATSVPPPVMVFLSKSPLVDEFHLTSLRMISCGGAPLKHQVEEIIKKRFMGRLTIFQGYGLTETTAGIIRSVFGKEIPGSTGMVEEGICVKVIDENGIALGPNAVGEICAKGNRIMKGYLNDPKATSETIDVDKWLHTGDLGYYNENFQFFIVDRLKELIKYKGFQVAPAELEGLLLTHPKCKDCGVIGIPDEICGELPLAFVVKQENVVLEKEEVIQFVKENMSNAKWLRGGVRFIDEIPKNPSGKILRKELRKMYKDAKSKL